MSFSRSGCEKRPEPAKGKGVKFFVNSSPSITLGKICPNDSSSQSHQVAFSRRFGALEMLYDEDQRVPGFPEIAILSNEKVDGKFIGVAAAGCAV
jgi:hypothetical protein